MGDIFIDIFVLFFVGTLMLILFCIGSTLQESQPTLFWLVPGLFYMGCIVRFMFRGFFNKKKAVVIVEEDDK